MPIDASVAGLARSRTACEAAHGQVEALVQMVCPASVQQFGIELPSPHSQHPLA
jgi:hypothetical protein